MYTSQQIKSNFNTFTILYWVGFGLSITILLALIGFFVNIAAVVFGCIHLYRCWKLLQDGKARTTPGKAVGFMFIPFFNLYWVFVAIAGLAKDVNQYLNERNIAGPRMNEGLALTTAILLVCGIIPWLGLLALLAATITNFIVLMQAKNAAMAIADYKNAQPPFLPPAN